MLLIRNAFFKRCSISDSRNFCRVSQKTNYSIFKPTLTNLNKTPIPKNVFKRQYADKLQKLLKVLPERDYENVPFEKIPEDDIDPEDAACIKEMESGIPFIPPTKARSDPSRFYINRDPYKKWDILRERRNFDEPIPSDYSICHANFVDPLSEIPLWHSLIIVGSVFLGSFALYKIGDIIGKKYDPWFQASGLANRNLQIPVFEEYDTRLKEPLIDNYLSHLQRPF